jgi:hypothetical protein
MEKAVTWAVQRVIEEDVDGSLAMAALLGATLDSATFTGIGVPPETAIVAGALTGAGLKVCKMVRGGKKQ